MADRRDPAPSARDRADRLRAGEVAAAAGVNVQTLHYYERLGLLAQAGRTAAGHRQYPARTVTLVRMIKNAQRLGFSLDEVARLIAAGADPDEIAAIAARKLTEVDAQIARLTVIREALALAASVANRDRASAEQVTTRTGGRGNAARRRAQQLAEARLKHPRPARKWPCGWLRVMSRPRAVR